MRATRFGFAISILLATTVSASPFGDLFSFHHQLGAEIDGVFKCFSEQMAGMNDNTVVFDGATELLDQYLNGNQPFIFEFEIASGVGGSKDAFEINTIAGGDLFPEGFEDPESGTSLTAACLEIGIDDTLDHDPPVSVVQANVQFSDDDGPLFPDPIPITSAFKGDPWNGRLSIVFPGFVGRGIREIRLMIETEPSPNALFADGFESGNTASWSDRSP